MPLRCQDCLSLPGAAEVEGCVSGVRSVEAEVEAVGTSGARGVVGGASDEEAL